MVINKLKMLENREIVVHASKLSVTVGIGTWAVIGDWLGGRPPGGRIACSAAPPGGVDEPESRCGGGCSGSSLLPYKHKGPSALLSPRDSWRSFSALALFTLNSVSQIIESQMPACTITIEPNQLMKNLYTFLKSVDLFKPWIRRKDLPKRQFLRKWKWCSTPIKKKLICSFSGHWTVFPSIPLNSTNPSLKVNSSNLLEKKKKKENETGKNVVPNKKRI